MIASKNQIKTINSLIEKNTSLKWDGVIGYYSNGWITINVFWSFEPESKCKITIDDLGCIL